MDSSMDYQSMPSLHFEPPFPSHRRCPYAVGPFQAGSVSQTRNPHIHYTGTALLPSLYPTHQLPLSTGSSYPISLPPPLPNAYYPNSNNFTRLPVENSFLPNSAQAFREQASLQHLNMSENDETRSNSSASFQSNTYEGTAPQSQTEADSRASMSALQGSYSDDAAGTVDRSVPSNPRALPPVSSFDRSTQSTSSRDIGGTSEGASFRSYVDHRLSMQDRARALAEAASAESGPPSTSPRDDIEAIQAYLSERAHGNDGSIDDLLDYMVQPLQNDGGLPMDDPRRLHLAAERMRLLRSFVGVGRAGARSKPGASKAALGSLVQISIEKLEEDDRSCQICYNDYGVENPEGKVEYPLQLPKCKHTFGDACLKKWLEEKSTCPYCRDQLPPDSHKSRNNRGIAAIEFHRYGEQQARNYQDSSTRQNTRHRVPAGRQSTESPEHNSTRDEAQRSRLESMNQHYLSEHRLQLEQQLAIRNASDASSTNFANQARTITPDAPSYANQRSPRRNRWTGNGSREFGPGRGSPQSDNRHAANASQPPIAMNTQQMPRYTPPMFRYPGEETFNQFYTMPMGPSLGSRVGTYNGDPYLSTGPSFPEAGLYSSNPYSQNRTGGYVPQAQANASAQSNHHTGYRDAPRQDGNHRLSGGYQPNYGRIAHGPGSDTSRMGYHGSNHTVDAFRGQDNPAQISRDFPSGIQPQPPFWGESLTLATEASSGERTRTRPDYAGHQRVSSQNSMTGSRSNWRQSTFNDSHHSPQTNHDPSRDANVPANNMAVSQEQTARAFNPGPSGAYPEQRFLPLPRTHSNPEAVYQQNSRNANTENDSTEGDYHENESEQLSWEDGYST